MKTSELITHLQTSLKHFGDLPVMILDEEYEKPIYFCTTMNYPMRNVKNSRFLIGPKREEREE